MSRAIRHRFLLELVRALSWLVHRLPQPWTGPLGEGLGRIAARIDGDRRRRAERQMAHRLGLTAPAARVLARNMYGHLGRTAVEVLRPPPLEENIELGRSAHAALESALAEGRGAIFVSAHVGNWEFLAYRVAQAGFRVAVVVRSLPQPGLERWLSGIRKAHRLELVYRGAGSSPVFMLRVLRSGGLIGVLLDQATRLPSVEVPFFGAPARTPIGPARLAVRWQLPVLVGFIERLSSCPARHTIRIERVLRPPPHGPIEAQARELTAALTARVEAAVRRHPEQWVWFHDRWVGPSSST